MIQTTLFPYNSFPIRLEFGEKKDTTICWFECEDHLQKYLNRYKLDKRTIKLDYRDKQPIQSSKTNKRKVESEPQSKDNRGSGSVRKRKSSVDTSRNTAGNTKRKKK